MEGREGGGSFFFVIIRRLQEQLHSWWFYSFQRLRFYRLFLFPFINFRSRYTREFPSMNLLTTRPGVEPRLIIHAWSCISQPSERGKTALCESSLLFFFLLYYYFIEFPFRNKYHKFFIYLFLRSLGWKESDVHHARLIWIFECTATLFFGMVREGKEKRSASTNQSSSASVSHRLRFCWTNFCVSASNRTDITRSKERVGRINIISNVDVSNGRLIGWRLLNARRILSVQK